jgi:hypothetical protein
MSPHQYQLQLRIGRARTLLSETTLAVKEIAFRSGFESEQYFCRLFKAKTGVSPGAWRRRYGGENLYSEQPLPGGARRKERVEDATHDEPGAPMNAITRSQLANIRSADRHEQGAAYSSLMKATSKPVDWAYEAWDELLEGLRHKDNRVRSISAQLLCNLAKSDPRGRMLKDFKRLLAGTKDPQFVTARHTLESLWHVGVVGEKNQAMVVAGLKARFQECGTEKNGTLIRYDILQGLRRLYDAVKDEGIRKQALALIATEKDPKYGRKYASVWR